MSSSEGESIDMPRTASFRAPRWAYQSKIGPAKTCMPVYAYLILSAISLIAIIYHHQEAQKSPDPDKQPTETLGRKIAFKLIFTGAFGYLIHWLCQNGWMKMAWTLALFPIILTIVAIFLVVSLTTLAVAHS